MSIDTNDPFDEFEFKPLTEGLGFHRKNEGQNSPEKKVEFKSSHLSFDIDTNTSKNNQTLQQKNKKIEKDFSLKSPLPRQQANEISTKATTFNTNSTQVNSLESMTDLTLNKSSNNILNSTIVPSTPLQRAPVMDIPTIEDDSIARAQTAVNDILKNLNHKKQQEEALNKAKRRLTWKETAPSLSAGFLDGMLVTALYLLSLILMLAITKVDLLANLNQPDPEYMVYWASAILFIGLQVIYFVTCRTFMGSTPGEWAFDQRCGNELQLASSTYTLKVIWRSILVIATGIIVTPIISSIFRFDILAKISGLQIQRQSM